MIAIRPDGSRKFDNSRLSSSPAALRPAMLGVILADNSGKSPRRVMQLVAGRPPHPPKKSSIEGRRIAVSVLVPRFNALMPPVWVVVGVVAGLASSACR